MVPRMIEKCEMKRRVLLVIHTKHILHVKYWSLIFSARRSTCCVIFSDGVGVGVGVVLVNGFVDGIGSDKCVRSVSFVVFAVVKLLGKRSNIDVNLGILLSRTCWYLFGSNRKTSLVSIYLFHLSCWSSHFFRRGKTSCSMIMLGILIYLTYDEMLVCMRLCVCVLLLEIVNNYLVSCRDESNSINRRENLRNISMETEIFFPAVIRFQGSSISSMKEKARRLPFV